MDWQTDYRHGGIKTLSHQTDRDFKSSFNLKPAVIGWNYIGQPPDWPIYLNIIAIANFPNM